MSTIRKQSVRPQQSSTESKQLLSDRREETAQASADEIRTLAYQKWQEAGSPVGDGKEFWLAAETEILRRRKPR